MDGAEIDTFISKFKQLWQSGLDAHLDLDTRAGQAWVGLRVQLGQAPGPLHQQNFHQPPRNSPSRQLRRARRAAERQEKDDKAVINIKATEKGAAESPNNIHENVVVETTLDDNEDKSVAEDAIENTRNSAVTDEFCPNEEYLDEDLNDKNSVTFRFVI